MTNMVNIKTGVAVAVAAAGLFAVSVPAMSAGMADKADVKCAGANGCKGKSECKTAGGSCKGTNSCKGQGWVKVASMEACKTAGGTVVK